MPRTLLALTLLLIVAASSVRAEDKSPLTFEAHIRPILKAYCFECHGEGEKLKGNLDLRLRRLIEKGGDSGHGLVAGKPADSLLVERLRSEEMPPGKKKLSKDELAKIERWIAEGAKTAKPEPEKIAAGLIITDDDRTWWSFQPIKRPAAPAIAANSPIDAFLLQKLREKNLQPSPEADKRTLIRRVTIDLTGLPPIPAEIDVFLADAGPDAYERLVDRLLASPGYGERWGRHWLDVAGYADSEGFSTDDPPRKNAWKYRDYVIRSFNADKPFDQFIREQLAGDELIGRDLKNLNAAEQELLIATGFLRMAPDGTATGSTNDKVAKNQVIAETIKIVSSSFLGLTIGCAQCHNHRYDPIPQSDYYRIRAFLEPALDARSWHGPSRQISLFTDADRQKCAEIEAEAAKSDSIRNKKQDEYVEATFQKELARLPESLREPAKIARSTPVGKRTPAQEKLMKEHPSLNVSGGSLYLYDPRAAAEVKKLTAVGAKIREKKPFEEFIRAAYETPGQVPQTFLFNRGDPDQPKEALTPAGLTVLESLIPLSMTPDPKSKTSGRRLALARWLTDPKHPLTARVLVNRFWMEHFGRGLVGSPGEFGKLGERPTHPELLDYLAAEFVSNGWKVKPLHKQIVCSTAYRQSSRRDPAKDLIDPDNRWLHRMSIRRLDAELVRDSILCASGKLNSKQFGPPIPVTENNEGQVVIGKGDKNEALGTVKIERLPNDEEYRRSIYVEIRRTLPLGLIETFDGPAMEPNCEFRISSTVTPQSLMLMNNEFVTSQSEFFADRLLKEAGTDTKSQVTRAWQLAFGLPPSDHDLRGSLDYLTRQLETFRARLPQDAKALKDHPIPEKQALATFCQAILSSNRFLYVD